MSDPRKPIFDAARAAKSAGFTQDQVDDMNASFDRAGIPKASTAMTLGPQGEAIIKKWEGYAKDIGGGKVQAYPDPATGGAPWTIGWGSTGSDIKQGTVWTQAQAQARFDSHAAEFADNVARQIGTTPTTQSQFDAMVSLCYNIGSGNFNGSTLLRKHTARDYAVAAAQFDAWIYANGKVMQGLVDRRNEEEALYRSGM